MKIIVLTSCTSTKQYKPHNQLSQKDFTDLSAERIAELEEYSLPAYQMYTGNQHARLMVGIEELRASGSTVDLYIISAGYGLLEGDQSIVPYECTFSGMKVSEIEAWASRLKIPEAVARLFQQTDYDLVLVLLGDTYLRAMQLTDNTVFGSPTLFLCASKSEKFIKGIGGFDTVKLAGAEAKLFHCGLVGLKGELARRLFVTLGEMDAIPYAVFDDLLSYLDKDVLQPKRKLAMPMIPLASVSHTFSSDKVSTHKGVKYFMPDWGDSVDADYDFINESHSGGRGGLNNQLYAHQIYERPNYDGLLISRAVVEKSGAKQATLYLHKVHSFMRVPKEFPIMGDCGAFSYIGQSTPPYQTNEMLDYYTELGFDLGVSIDHLWFGADTRQEQQERYDLTITNAEAFLREHQKRGLDWTPIGAIQGWDVETYTNAAVQLVKMGYDYIGLGGVVKTKTNEIISYLEAIKKAIPPHIRIHVFGVARLKGIQDYNRLNVTSADSSSPLRKAWLDMDRGYFFYDAPYSALRIPLAENLINKEKKKGYHLDSDSIIKLEQTALAMLRNYDRGKESLDNTLNALITYDNITHPYTRCIESKYSRTLESRVWKECGCPICKAHGVEVMVFRCGNRNRRRGFHNTYIFYSLMQKLLHGESISPHWLS